jgi:hypothetical protein
MEEQPESAEGIFGRKRDGDRNLEKTEELHNVYCSSNINYYDDRITLHECGRDTEHKLAGETVQ